MKPLLQVAGVIAVVLGLFWAAQGAGYVTWPSESFMINNTRWVYYGLATAVVGAVLVAMGRR